MLNNCIRSALIGWLSLSLGLLLLTVNVRAEQSPTLYDRYSLQVSAESEIENDLMTAHLTVEDEDRNSAELADRINQEMLWALLQIERYPSITSSTQNYSTYPKYEHNRIVGWRSSQTLMLKGKDFDEIKAAIGVLQERLTVRSMRFKPTPETRQEAEDKLIADALAAFRKRSVLIQSSMQATDYRVIHMSVDTNGYSRPVYRAETMAMDARGAAKSVTQPAVDAGTSRIQIVVHGEIQLQ